MLPQKVVRELIGKILPRRQEVPYFESFGMYTAGGVFLSQLLRFPDEM